MEIEKSTIKFIWKHRGPQIAKAILSKKSNVCVIMIPAFKPYYRAIVTKISWYCIKTYIQTSGIEGPEKFTQLQLFDFRQRCPKHEKTASSTVLEKLDRYV
jgi:hypothetical protein